MLLLNMLLGEVTFGGLGTGVVQWGPGRLDNYARSKLLLEIDDLIECLCGEESSLDVWDWLANLSDEVWVGGSGPRGGCLHVAHVLAGGPKPPTPDLRSGPI